MNHPLPFAEVEVESSIIARWQRVVAHFPQAIAIATPDCEQYSYQGVDQASNRLAHALVAQLGEGNDPVILLLDHSPAMLISIVGLLKANKAYVALDPTQATGQLQQLSAASAAAIIVTDNQYKTLAQAIATTGQQIWPLESLPDTGAGCPTVAIAPDAIAGIFFTSGTSSRPKGIPRNHRCILHQAWFDTSFCHFTPDARISGLRYVGLGGGAPDLFSAFLNGSAYCLYPLQTRGLAKLSSWLQTEQITYFHPPLVLYRAWLDTLQSDAFFPHLCQILPSGRQTRNDLTRLWPHVSPTCAVLTSYSATETNGITRSIVDRFTRTNEGVLHVGQPLPGKKVTIVKDDGQPAAVDEVGEIVVRSRYVSTEYWRQPELTAKHFIPANDGSGETIFHTGDYGVFRDDGCLELVGRQDSQVKLRGYRVVLDEVEDALRALPSVKDVVVTADEEKGWLLTYFIAATDPPAPSALIRGALAQTLPHYALPTHITCLPHFPLLSSGKVDRRALPAPSANRPSLNTPFVAPYNEMEQQIAAIWAELLELGEVGVEDDFFELGGDSILAMRMVLAVEQTVDSSVPAEFFRQPTVAHLTRLLIQGADVPHTAPTAVPAQPLAKPAQRREHSVRRKLRTQGIEIGPCWRGYGLPYGLGVRLQRLLVAQPFIRRRYVTQLALVQRWSKELGIECDGEDLATISLLANTWLVWRKHALLPPANLDRWWKISDPHNALLGSPPSSAGVVLAVPHVGKIGAILLEICRRSGRETGSVIGGAQVGPKIRSEMLLDAERILHRGGVVMVPADGLQGNQTIDVPFWGRRRSFQIGAAELAVTTGAAFIPVYIHIDAKGRIDVEILAPLLAQTATSQDKIRELTERYGADYGARWPQFYASMRWHHLAYNLNLPRNE